jgi:uncharacterized PurR-regulated membrane protein YhhQ (DUF165 family)
MKDFTFETMWAITAEMFGFLLWPGIVLAAIIAVLFLAALLRQRGFSGRPARNAIAIGLLVAIVAVAVAPFTTQAAYGNVHGVVDWTFLALIGTGVFVATAITAFALLGIGSRRSAQA